MGKVELICKQDGIICGLQVFKRVFELLDDTTVTELYCKDGDEVKAGQLMGVVTGDIRVLLSGERTALNYLQRMSGIATGTYKAIAAFLGTGLTCFATFISLRVTLSAHAADLPAAHLLRLHRYFHSRPMLSPCVPTVLFICGTGI